MKQRPAVAILGFVLLSLIVSRSAVNAAYEPVDRYDVYRISPLTQTPSPPSSPQRVDLSSFYDQLRRNPVLLNAICQPDTTFKLHDGHVAVPILLYHFVGRTTLEEEGKSSTRYNVTIDDFRAQLAVLHRLGYQTITVSEIAQAINNDQPLPDRPVAITVDDGWIEQYTNIFPLLQQYNMRATFYIPSAYPVGERLMTWEQVKALNDAGMEIGSHTHTHIDLTTMDQSAAWQQLVLSKQILEKALNTPVLSISYPFGNYTSNLKAMAARAGYESAVALAPSVIHGQYDLYNLHRLEIFGTATLTEFVDLLPWRANGTTLCFRDKTDKCTPQ